MDPFIKNQIRYDKEFNCIIQLREPDGYQIKQAKTYYLKHVQIKKLKEKLHHRGYYIKYDENNNKVQLLVKEQFYKKNR